MQGKNDDGINCINSNDKKLLTGAVLLEIVKYEDLSLIADNMSSFDDSTFKFVCFSMIQSIESESLKNIIYQLLDLNR